ncbi:MBL fold metallo-hydrolase [Kordiimonas laminariae]|uniref:MBL fold metallo-hydrolase n=1 Tax=Kordiimonas laminariae TaxID=2917717 RepID=UPI001FF30C99|nr:MBL fold metallo-hydrolase [Kordiimonas laminariae]MCK0068886.1 MBL fold metallo-hydrolase [Kordiimonas laminariae]
MKSIAISSMFLLSTALSASAHADMTVVLLGTGTPNPVPERAGAATAVIVGGKPWIIDAGPGVVRRISAAERNGIKALAQPNLSRALLTHLHSDHTLGLPDLIYSPWTLERTEPLKIYGPKGTVQMVDFIQKAYSEDVNIRIEGTEPANTTGWQVDASDATLGIIYKDDALTIEAIPVCHGDWKEAYGFKFTHEGKSVVISGDTTYCPALEEAAKDADLLIHEVYDAEALAKRTEDWQAYHKAAHTSGPDVGKLASNANVKHLVLHHQLVWSGSKDAVINQIRQTYGGDLTWGEDLMVFKLGKE